MAGICYLFS